MAKGSLRAGGIPSRYALTAVWPRLGRALIVRAVRGQRQPLPADTPLLDCIRHSGRVGKQHDELYDRQSAIERRIIDTPATSVGGLAVKLRLLAYTEFPYKGLPDLHRTPAKDTDFKGIIEAWRETSGLFWDDELLIGTLRDAERLGGAP